MGIYIIFILLLYIVWQGHESIIRFNTMLLIILLFGYLRDVSVGTDYIHYIDSFKSSVYNFDLSQLQVFSLSDNAEFFNTDNRTSREFTWNILISTISLITTNPFIIIHSVLTIIVLIIAKGIKRISPYPCMSLFLYVALYIFFPSFNTIRQELAVALCFLAITYFIKKQYLPFIFIYSLAATVHTSALFILFFFPLLLIKKRIHIRFFYIIGLALLLFQALNIKILTFASFLPAGIDSEYYLNHYSTGDVGLLANLFFLIINVILIFFFLISYKYHDLESSGLLYFWFAGLAYLLFFYFNKVVTRPTEYFLIFQIIIIPSIYKRNNNSIKPSNYLYLMICYSLSVYLFNLLSNNQGIVPYKF